jgi:hypothetical protein
LRTSFYANLEGDIGQAQRALLRLLGEANRHGNDPELFAGLVQACRYCGLYDESVAAHAEARRLDPNVPTSLGQTLLISNGSSALSRRRSARAAISGFKPVSLASHWRGVETRHAICWLKCAKRRA